MSWDDYAATWDDDPAVQAYSRAAFRSLQRHLAGMGFTLDGAKACDFGCGTGLLTESLVEAGCRVDAVDSSPAMLAELNRKVRARGWEQVRLMAELPSLTDERYDIIVCSSVCAFLDDYPGTLAAMHSLLNRGGLLFQWGLGARPHRRRTVRSVTRTGAGRPRVGRLRRRNRRDRVRGTVRREVYAALARYRESPQLASRPATTRKRDDAEQQREPERRP